MREPRLAIGRRVVVTGLAGSGKSTFAVAFAAKTGLSVIHLDLFFWKPGWVAPSEAEWRDKQRVVLAGEAWIADGNYHETLDLRLELADTLVVLDTPWWRCSGRALVRGFRMPGQLPPGCDYSRWARWRDEWRLAGRVFRKRRSEPEREREVAARYGQHVAVHVLRSTRAVTDLLDRFDADERASTTADRAAAAVAPHAPTARRGTIRRASTAASALGRPGAHELRHRSLPGRRPLQPG